MNNSTFAWLCAAGYKARLLVIVLGAQFFSATALADGDLVGLPQEWQMGFQEASSPTMRHIVSIHDWLMIMMLFVVLLVIGLMVYIIYKFREKKNPIPSTTTHHVGLEVLWTAVPAVALLVMGFLTMPYIYIQDTIPKSDVTIKITGYQWYWGYEYPDEDGLSFDSTLLSETPEETPPGAYRLLSVDNEIVVPVNKVVRLQITAADVLHAFALPALGVKRDAVPGRLNETWFIAEKTGWYFGQCSELCGGRHAYMPIAVRVVSESEYRYWLSSAKQEFAVNQPLENDTMQGEGFSKTASLSQKESVTGERGIN